MDARDATPEMLETIELDERSVKVLAHPLRSRILSRLRIAGPATATTIAAALGTNSGATSYHLRALESVGLVVDTEEGAGRRRLWRAASRAHSWVNSAFDGDEDARTAMDWLQRDYVRQFAVRAEEWLDAATDWPAEWVDAMGLSDTFLEVTPAQAADLQRELAALAEKYRDAGAGDASARRIHLTTFTRPVDLG